MVFLIMQILVMFSLGIVLHVLLTFHDTKVYMRFLDKIEERSIKEIDTRIRDIKKSLRR